MIEKIEVPEEHRPVFLGKAAAAMLTVVVGAGVISGCLPVATGIRPEEEAGEDQPEATDTRDPEDPGPTRGIRADPVEPREDTGGDK
jgi:hypothetical protein